jgi:hypothetical protein
MLDRPDVTLSNLCGGAVGELFMEAWNAAAKNIKDVNTDPEAKRVITLQVILRPDEKRESADVEINVTSKLPSFRPATTRVFIGRDGGRIVAKEYNPQQMNFDAPGSHIVAIEGGKTDKPEE